MERMIMKAASVLAVLCCVSSGGCIIQSCRHEVHGMWKEPKTRLAARAITLPYFHDRTC